MSSREPRRYPYAPDPGDAPLGRGAAWGGWLVTRTVVWSALLLVLGSLAAALLSLGGLWQPWVAAAVLLGLAVVSGFVAALVPVRPLPVWSAGLLVALALGAMVWAGTTHSEQVLPRRDSGSYLQSAIQLAAGHQRPIDVAPGTVGGADVLDIDGITLASPAFYQTGTPQDPSIQPQFPVGPSAWYSVAWWLGGQAGVAWAPAILFGLTVLGVGLLTATVVGPRWGPLAALATALVFPLLHVARSTYSEPVALPVLVAGLLAMVLAARSAAYPDVLLARRTAVVAGVLMGGAITIRVDALREVVLVVPVVVLASLQRQAHARALGLATAVSATVAFGVTWLTSSEYLRSIAGSLLPLVAMGVAACLLGVVLLVGGRRGWSLPTVARAWLPRVLAGGFVVVGLVLASRPWWQVVRQSAADPGARVVAGLQARQGLPVDGGRTYAEHTLVWMAWWLGPAALALALVATAVLAHRAAAAWVDDRELPAWTGAAVVTIGSTLLTLYRPGITPDHPWADRRLVIALPTVVVLTVACSAWIAQTRLRRIPYVVNVAAGLAVVAALLVPTALATRPHVDERVELGEWAAVDTACRSLRPGDVALMVDSRAANEWPQVLRGYCGVSALSTTSALRNDPVRLGAAVEQVQSAVEDRGGRLVLVAADSTEALERLGLKGAVVGTDARVQEDDRLLERRPDALVELPIRLYLARLG
ncbi:hypothetical protein SAMN04489867_1943 [Pedococcus dokdonensis]|uniref:Dolichyl-phosphate-mannose-protein mannosyltransferase n=1 Tax=Pedococcus dokdonensis TaxID=443156 RepID=A0A1H0RFT4_9MICO|nr:hypothetical protein [Pedococcus dokdonensis]SDP28250.1 hypothetical protein SAMN04489867_1943 [Pedococcus dokdonensis]